MILMHVPHGYNDAGAKQKIGSLFPTIIAFITFLLSRAFVIHGLTSSTPSSLSSTITARQCPTFMSNSVAVFPTHNCRHFSSMLMSSEGGNFYNDFEDFEEDDDDEDDDDDDYEDLDVANFRSRLNSIMGDEDEKNNDVDDDVSGSVDELISFANSMASSLPLAPTPSVRDWAEPLFPFNIESAPDSFADILKEGTVLLANPSKFCSDFDIEPVSTYSETSPSFYYKSNSGNSNNSGKNFLGGVGGGSGDNVSSGLLSKFGLTLPPPLTLGPDRRADLLPVLVILERQTFMGCQAVLLNRRTGYLIGDLEQEEPPTAPLPSDFDDDEDDDDDDNLYKSSTTTSSSSSSETSSEPGTYQRLWAFMIQPLWFGGTSPGDLGGLDMIHPCDNIPNAKTLTEDGLFWGGDPGIAQQIMEGSDVDVTVKGEYDEDGNERKRPLSGFDFKFFVQRTRWLPTQLEKEVRDGTWFVAKVSKDVLFKSRDRLGTKRAKPLWTEVMELMGGEYKEVRDQFYEPF